MKVLIRKLVVFLVITFIVGLSGCLGPNSADLEPSGLDKSREITDSASKEYTWRIDYYGREDGRDMGILRFENTGNNLSGVKFKFEFYKSNGSRYSVESVSIGDVASGEIVQMKVSLPGRYLGTETWSKEKTFVYANGVWEEQQSGEYNIYKNKGIIDNANRLLGDYKWKLELVTEIQKRTDALGTAATKEMYTEWKFRNREAIDSGERLATYITERRDVLDQYWTSDVLVLIATNKVTFERDNQALERIINSRELQGKRYRWLIDYYGREGSRDMGILRFENMDKNLAGVKFRFEFYKSSGALYSTESLDIGDVASGEIVRKKVSLPGRYLGGETWSEKKIFVYVNGVWEEQQY